MYRNLRITRTMILVLSSLCSPGVVTHAQNIVSSGQPTGPVTFLDSSKEQDGLKGSVRRVKTQSATLELKSGRVIEGALRLLEITTYDRNGKRIENVSYPVSSSSVGKEEYKYDDNGNIVQMTLRADDGSIVSRETYEYEFDKFNNWTKMVTSLVIFEDDQLKREPIEVTFRTLTYYFDESVARIIDPVPRPIKLPVPEATQSTISNTVSFPTAPYRLPGPNSSGSSQTMLAGPPPELKSSPEKVSPGARSEVERNSNSLKAEPIKLPVPEATESPVLNAVSFPNVPYRLPGPNSSGSSQTVLGGPPPELKSLSEKVSPAARSEGETSVNSLKAQPKTEGRSPVSESSASRERKIDRDGGVAKSTAPNETNETTARKSALEYYNNGRELFASGDSNGAVRAYQQSIQLESGSSEVYLSLGQAYLNLKKNGDAVKAFTQSVRLNPKNAEAYYALGLTHYNMKHSKDAADAFRKATALRPDMAKAHYGLALAYQDLERQDGLIAEYRILEKLDHALAIKLSQSFPQFNFPCRGNCK